MFLRQRLQALDTGWNELHKMWENRQSLLSQSHAHQQFLRDTKQAEAFLNNQVTSLTAWRPPHQAGPRLPVGCWFTPTCVKLEEQWADICFP